MDIFDLQGATTLVTGAGQGVGREIALRFAQSNAGAVVVNDVNRDRAEKVAHEVEALGADAAALVADVTDFASVSGMVDEALARFGGVDVLVNNAGNFGAEPSRVEQGSFWELDPQNWDPVVAVNLFGPMNCMRAVLPSMITRASGGRLITIISDAGRVGEPGLEAYSAAKAGAAGLTRAVAKSVGRYGITANNVAIAATRTPLTADSLEDEERLKKLLSHYVIRRVGEPEDVAPVVLLLASPASAWITGQTYPVNGGYSFNL